MKALRLVFLASVCILIVGSLRAQVKIGDNKLDLGAERLLEIERAGELLIVTDSLELGLTDNQNLNVTTDALMLKLFGYGLEQFTPLLTSKTQDFFLASNSDGEVMQIPLTLDLVVADSTTADLSLFNGVDTFGTVDLMMLDSIFATDIALRDSTALLRTLISDSEASDGDTLTGNEWLASVVTSGTELVFTENVTGIDTQHVTRVDLDGIWATDMQLADTSTILRNLIDSLSLYTHDGTLEEDRTVTGANLDLTFTGLDTFAVSGTGTTITATGTNTITSNDATTITADGDNSGAGDLVFNTGGTDVVTIQPDEDVLIGSATVDSSLYIDNSGSITAEIYGTGTTTGTFANIIGVTAAGELIDVTVADILATDADSSIYTHDGALATDRTLTGASNDLTFTGLDTFAVSGAGMTVNSTGTNTLTSTGQTTVNSAALDINAAAITVDGSSITETSTGAITLDAATTASVLGDGNTTITGDGDNSGAGDLYLNTGGTNVVTIQPDEDVLVGSATVDSSLYIDNSGSITAEIYGTGATTGTFANIIGVTAAGELIDVTVADILATDADSSIYTHDGALATDRTLTGASNDLTFTGLDTFAVSGAGMTVNSTGTNTLTSTGQTTVNSAALDINAAAITVDGSSITETSTGAITLDAATTASVLGDGNTTITGDGDNSGAGDLYLNTGGTNVVTIQPDEDVLIGSATVDSSLYIDNSGSITAEIYGTATTTGTFANIIGVTAAGELIDVTVADILATDADSSIYTHDGSLAADRTLTGASNDLTFTGLDTFAVSGAGMTVNSTGTNTLTSTGQTTVNSAALDINAAAITVDGSSITETSTGAIDLDAATDLTASGDGNATVTADEDNSGAGDLYLNTGGTNVVTIEPDEDVLIGSATVDSSLYIDNSGSITAEIYGTATTTGTFANIIGVTAAGELIDVTVADILASDADSSIYTHDGTLATDRTLTGASNDLTFTGLDTFAVSGAGMTVNSTGTNTLTSTGQTTVNSAALDINAAAITVDGSSITETSTGAITLDAATTASVLGDGNTTITGDGDNSGAGDLYLNTGGTNVVTIQPDEDVLIGSATVDSSLYIDNSGSITAEIYGTATTTGTFANIIGVTAAGELIDVTVADILATDADSSIYTHDGALATDRTLTGASNDLTFTGLDTFAVSGAGMTVNSTGTNTLTSTGQTTVNSGALDINAAAITVDGSSITETSTGAIDLDAATDLTASGDGNATVTADEDNSGAGDLYLNTGGTNVVTIQPDEDVLIGSATVDSSLYIDNSGSITAEIYGTGATTGTFANIIGVTAAGELIDVTVADILATDADSSIYTHDGSLAADRTLTGASNDLTFTGLDTFAVSGAGMTVNSTGTNTLTSTGQTTVNSGALDINAAAITVDGSSITETSTGAITLDAATTASLLGDGNTTITGDGDNSGAGDLYLNTGGTNVVTIQPDEDVLIGSATVDSSLYIDNSGSITAEIYGTGATTGTFANIIGVTAAGELIDVTVSDILATDSDSTIYTHNGTLTAERTMWMDSKNLFFVSGTDGSGNTDTITITPDGRMAIGRSYVTVGKDTSSNGIRLDVNGDILAVQVHSSSDERFKKNIEEVEGALDKVMQIDGVMYDFRTDEFPNRQFPTTKQLGFVAQNVEGVLPEVVKTDGEGFKSIDYAKVTALLNEAIKEQQKMIADQQNRIAKLEARLGASLDNNEVLINEIASIKSLLKELVKAEVAED